MTLAEMARHPRRWLAAAGVAGAVILGLFAWFPYNYGYGNRPVSVLFALNYLWKVPEWEHAPLVLVIVPVVVYLRRGAIGALPVAPGRAWWIWPVFAVLYWVGYQVDITALSFLILHLFVVLCLYWYLGRRVVRGLAFPLAFLAFTWPVPFLDTIAFRLRVVMSQISEHFLNLVGVACVRSGTSLQSMADGARGLVQGEIFAVDIADPCSGIRSLFALTMVTALYAYFSLDRVWKQWALFACAVPLAIAGNFFRILMLTFGTILLGPETAIGTLEEPTAYHMGAGYSVFLVALGGMAGMAWLLKRVGRS